MFISEREALAGINGFGCHGLGGSIARAATGDVTFTSGNEIASLAATQVNESHATQKKSNNLLGFENLSGRLDNGW